MQKANKPGMVSKKNLLLMPASIPAPKSGREGHHPVLIIFCLHSQLIIGEKAQWPLRAGAEDESVLQFLATIQAWLSEEGILMPWQF